MSTQNDLLEQLRINRSDPPTRDHRRRGRWPLWLAAVVVIGAVAVGISRWQLLDHHAVLVRAVAAKAAAPDSSLHGNSSLLDASGYVVALREATVSGKSIYKVNEVLIQEGQQVKQGDVLARLDDTNTRAALEQSQAQVKQTQALLAAAKVAANDAQPIFVRSQKQFAEGLISQDVFEASKATYDAAQMAVSVAAENLAVAQANVTINQRYEDDTVIRAPFDAVVTVTTAQPGEIVSPQFSGGGGIAKIVDMNSLEVDVDVSENYINRVHPHQPATITLGAYPDWRIPAEVIAVIPTADRAKATVKVRLGFKESDSRIVPEMGARVSFLEASSPQPAANSPRPSEVLVPPEAVQTHGDTGLVYVISGDHIQSRKVQLGSLSNAGQTVLGGLQAGALLAVGDFARLHDGMKIRISP